MSGNSAGTLLAPYVNYKAEHMWSTWTENGVANLVTMALKVDGSMLYVLRIAFNFLAWC